MVTHLIALGLVQYPAFLQITAVQAAHADVTVSGRIEPRNGGLLLHPMMMVRKAGQPTTISLPSRVTRDADLVTQVASLSVSYAEALADTFQVALTDQEKWRINKAALATRSLRALELYTRGRNAFDRGAHQDAVDLIWNGVSLDASFVAAQYWLGRAHQTLGSRWKAAAQYRAATQLDSAMPEPYAALGDLFLIQPRRLFDQAIEAYSYAIQLRPSYVEAFVGLGNAKAVKGDVNGAIAAYQEALKLAPFHAPAYVGLGRVYESTGRCGDSVSLYSRALELDPNSADARKALEPLAAGNCIPVGP